MFCRVPKQGFACLRPQPQVKTYSIPRRRPLMPRRSFEFDDGEVMPNMQRLVRHQWGAASVVYVAGYVSGSGPAVITLLGDMTKHPPTCGRRRSVLWLPYWASQVVTRLFMHCYVCNLAQLYCCSGLNQFVILLSPMKDSSMWVVLLVLVEDAIRLQALYSTYPAIDREFLVAWYVCKINLHMAHYFTI